MNAPLQTVLVIADEPDATVLKEGLKRAGFGYRVASAHADAEQEVKRTAFSAVMIAESSLPEDPSVLFQALRRETGSPLVVAGWGGPDIRAEILLDGADSYLVRPIPDDILRARLRALDARRTPYRREGFDPFLSRTDSPN